MTWEAEFLHGFVSELKAGWFMLCLLTVGIPVAAMIHAKTAGRPTEVTLLMSRDTFFVLMFALYIIMMVGLK